MESKRNLQYLYILFGVVVAINFWSYIEESVAIFANRASIILFLLSSIFLFTGNKKNHSEDEFHSMVIWTIFTIFLSTLPAYLNFGQSFYISIRSCMSLSYGLLFYFLFKKWDFPETKLIKIITTVCIIWVALEIGQQFTYPQILFSSTLSKLGFVSERMGLYRVYIWGVDFVMIIYSLYLGKINSKNRTQKDILLFLIMFIGLLCYCSRKHIFSCLLVFVFSVLNVKGSKKILYSLIVLAVLAFLYNNFYSSFLEMSEAAQENQGEGEDFVRFISAQYFLFEYSPSSLYPLWGGGIPGGEGPLYDLMNNLADMRIYQADVGIIGYYSMVGLLGVFPIILYIYKFFKNWKYIDDWFKYFFIMKLLLIIFDFWAVWGVGMFAYAVFLYLLEKNIQKNKALYFA